MVDMDQCTFVIPINYFRCIKKQKNAYISDPLSISPWLILQLIFYSLRKVLISVDNGNN